MPVSFGDADEDDPPALLTSHESSGDRLPVDDALREAFNLAMGVGGARSKASCSGRHSLSQPVTRHTSKLS
jgi:hypothetical protein